MKFKTSLIDAPWPEQGAGRIRRGADPHYPLMKVADMPRVILESRRFTPADDAHLYVWSTNNYLPSALGLIGELGFRYITTITWVKPKFGIGQYFRGQTEPLLFAVRGKGLELRRRHTSRLDLPTVIHADLVKDEANKTIHSAKPPASYELIEAASPGPRLEMFARLMRPNT